MKYFKKIIISFVKMKLEKFVSFYIKDGYSNNVRLNINKIFQFIF